MIDDANDDFICQQCSNHYMRWMLDAIGDGLEASLFGHQAHCPYCDEVCGFTPVKPHRED